MINKMNAANICNIVLLGLLNSLYKSVVVKQGLFVILFEMCRSLIVGDLWQGALLTDLFTLHK